MQSFVLKYETSVTAGVVSQLNIVKLFGGHKTRVI